MTNTNASTLRDRPKPIVAAHRGTTVYAPENTLLDHLGTFMGTRLLAERQTRRRLVAAAAMALGIVALVVP